MAIVPTSTVQAAFATQKRKGSEADFSNTLATNNNTTLNLNNCERPDMKSHRKHSIVPTMDRVDRTSFSSIKESNSGIAQSFTTTKTSSYLNQQFEGSQDEEAIEDGLVTPPEGLSGLKHAHPKVLHGLVCPCDGFKGWKGIDLGPKMRTKSKSFGDLKALGHRFSWDSHADVQMKDVPKVESKKVQGQYPSGEAPIEKLPMELLGSIIDQLATDIPPNGFTARNIDLMSLLLTSRNMHSATLATLYNHITIPHSRIFRKFLSHVAAHPALGTIVRRLDFSHFNPTGAGITARERAETKNLIPETMLQCLSLTPNLREFLAQEHIDDDLDAKVITTLLCELPKLKALDLCACSSSSFRDSFSTVIDAEPSPLPAELPLTRLSLHECPILPARVFTTLLPRLAHLTHLDVAHTRITDEALMSIPGTAQLTHLNLSKCTNLSGEAVLRFLSTHPAAKTLVYLNLAMDSKSAEMLSSEEITELLPILPPTMKSLNLKGSRMDNTHIPLLLPLTKHLEELGLGRNLDLPNLCRLFVPDEDLDDEEQLDWVPHTLRYIDVSDLSVAQLDLGTLFGSRCPVLKGITAPLEVLEVNTEVFKKLEKSPVVKRVGWCLKEAGRRYWLVKVKGADDEEDTGARSWKWGACYWGMRKVPMARQEVGGMYGHYMFKR